VGAILFSGFFKKAHPIYRKGEIIFKNPFPCPTPNIYGKGAVDRQRVRVLIFRTSI